jgi:hypothetical protein
MGAGLDEASPAVIGWIGMDFGQYQRAFPLAEARDAARKIVEVYFRGATFFNSTGAWEGTENGGMAVQLYSPVRGDDDPATLDFINRMRAAAWHIKKAFEQYAVSVVTQLPSGKSYVEFVGEDTKKVPTAEQSRLYTKSEYTKKLYPALSKSLQRAHSRRLSVPTVVDPANLVR